MSHNHIIRERRESDMAYAALQDNVEVERRWLLAREGGLTQRGEPQRDLGF